MKSLILIALCVGAVTAIKDELLQQANGFGMEFLTSQVIQRIRDGGLDMSLQKKEDAIKDLMRAARPEGQNWTVTASGKKSDSWTATSGSEKEEGSLDDSVSADLKLTIRGDNRTQTQDTSGTITAKSTKTGTNGSVTTSSITDGCWTVTTVNVAPGIYHIEGRFCGSTNVTQTGEKEEQRIRGCVTGRADILFPPSPPSRGNGTEEIERPGRGGRGRGGRGGRGHGGGGRGGRGGRGHGGHGRLPPNCITSIRVSKSSTQIIRVGSKTATVESNGSMQTLVLG